MLKTIDYSLYVVTDDSIKDVRKLVKIVEEAILGGATIVQLRDKNASTRMLVSLGQVLHSVTRKHNVPLIINDRIDVVLAVGAEGVHLGQDDMPVSVAKKILNQMSLRAKRSEARQSQWGLLRRYTPRNDDNGFIIGVSVKTVAQAKKAQKEGADYLGAGDIFGTKSKHDAGKPIGVVRLEQIVQSVSIPVVGIGGINADNASSVIKIGAKGVAVISAISKAKDPKKAAGELLVAICHSELFKLSP